MAAVMLMLSQGCTGSAPDQGAEIERLRQEIAALKAQSPQVSVTPIAQLGIDLTPTPVPSTPIPALSPTVAAPPAVSSGVVMTPSATSTVPIPQVIQLPQVDGIYGTPIPGTGQPPKIVVPAINVVGRRTADGNQTLCVTYAVGGVGYEKCVGATLRFSSSMTSKDCWNTAIVGSPLPDCWPR